MDEEQVVRQYFNAWLQKDGSQLRVLFDPDVVYVECYGPEYHGIEQIRRWFFDWNQRGTVTRWDIGRFVLQERRAAVEWTFACEYDGAFSAFDGVSLIEFNESGAMAEVREYQSKQEHVFPYGC
ncbi:MAG: nuclear transport factor 2 family protein [Clostridiaceae bacterium]